MFHFFRILLILVLALIIEGSLDWKVHRMITKFGQEVVLFCRVEGCCSESAGWTKHISDYYSKSIFLNVRNLKYNSTWKYDGRVGNDGFYLFIRNFSVDDTQFAYSCSYGLNSSKPKILIASMVLEEVLTTSATPSKDNKATYNVIIAVLGTLVFTLLCCAAAYTCITVRKKRSKVKKQEIGDEEIQQLSEKGDNDSASGIESTSYSTTSVEPHNTHFESTGRDRKQSDEMDELLPETDTVTSLGIRSQETLSTSLPTQRKGRDRKQSDEMDELLPETDTVTSLGIRSQETLSQDRKQSDEMHELLPETTTSLGIQSKETVSTSLPTQHKGEENENSCCVIL